MPGAVAKIDTIHSDKVQWKKPFGCTEPKRNAFGMSGSAKMENSNNDNGNNNINKIQNWNNNNNNCNIVYLLNAESQQKEDSDSNYGCKAL